jgi:hypothetical protein
MIKASSLFLEKALESLAGSVERALPYMVSPMSVSG